jgi:hypothetical protein
MSPPAMFGLGSGQTFVTNRMVVALAATLSPLLPRRRQAARCPATHVRGAFLLEHFQLQHGRLHKESRL